MKLLTIAKRVKRSRIGRTRGEIQNECIDSKLLLQR